MPSRILLIEDDEAFRRMLEEALAELGHEVVPAVSAEDGLDLVRALAGPQGGGEVFDLILTDVRLPGMTGVAAIPHLREASPGTEIIVMTAYPDHETALDAMRQGASDFFTKPFRLSEMQIVVARALERRGLKREIGALREVLRQGRPARKAVGDGPAMRAVLAFVERVAGLDTSVLILGESGTGKEVVADLIHEASPRASGPFVKVNCASIPENLLESELFGHEKGAFTGAFMAKAGKFELAKGGSLLLDEIGDMPLHLQPKLLRAVEQKQSERVGGVKPLRFDVRIIAATNVDLVRRVADKTFREDLYYRLNVIAVALPGLHERPGDLARLAESYRRFFAVRLGKKLGAFSPAVAAAFAGYRWPGNLRELRNVIERAAILATGETIELHDLPEEFGLKPDPAVAVGARVTLDQLEAEHIRRVLAMCRSLDEAARVLGIDPATLYRKRQKLGLL